MLRVAFLIFRFFENPSGQRIYGMARTPTLILNDLHRVGSGESQTWRDKSFALYNLRVSYLDSII